MQPRFKPKAADEAGLFAPVKSATLEKRIPAQFRANDNAWFGFSYRARVIAYDKNKLKPEQIASYLDMAKPEFKGKVCVRSGNHPYNLTLMASIINHNGEAKALQWAEGIVTNLARAPKGGGMLKHAPHKEAAVKFMEYLASDAAQAYFANGNNEWPVVAGIKEGTAPDGWRAGEWSAWGGSPLRGLGMGRSHQRKDASRLQLSWQANNATPVYDRDCIMASLSQNPIDKTSASHH